MLIPIRVGNRAEAILPTDGHRARGCPPYGCYSAATLCAATPRAFTTTLMASSTRSLA